MKTTRGILIAAAVAVAVLGSGPSTLAHAGIRPGIDAGPSFVWTNYDETLDEWTTGDRLDFSGGITGELSLAPRWALVSGVRYSGLGNQVEYTTLLGSGEFEVHQNYLVVPLWVRFDVPGMAGLFVQAGPEYGVLLSAKATRTEDGEELPDEDIKDTLESGNFSLGVGLGARRSLGARSLEFVLRHSRGLSDTAKPEEWFSTWKTREIHVGLGLR